MKIDEKKAIERVLEDYNSVISSSYHTQKKEDWKKWQKMYLGKKEPTSFPFEKCSNVDLGIIQTHTDSISSRLKLALIGADPMFSMSSALVPETDITILKEDIMTSLLRKNIKGDTGKVGIEPIVDTIVHNISVFGTCITKHRWEVKPISQKRYRTIQGFGIATEDLEALTEEDRTVIIRTEEERLRVDIIDLEHFLVSDDVSNIQEASFCIHRLYLTETELKARKKVYQNVEKVLKWLSDKKEEKTAQEKEEGKEGKWSRERVEVVEWYGQFEVDGKIQECIFTVAVEPQILLRKSLLIDIYWDSQRPFHRFVLEDIGSFYGRGVVEKLAPTAEALNDLYNFSVNMGYLVMMPPGFYDENAEVKEIEIAPGRLNPINGNPHQALTFIQYPALPQVGQAFISILNNYIERKTAVSAPMQGVELPTKRTATEVRSFIEEGNVRHQDTIQSLRADFALFLKSIYNLYQQNIPQPLLDQLSQGRLTREMFAIGDETFIIEGTLTAGNQLVEREENLMLYNLLSTNLLIKEDIELNIELLINILQTFGKKGLIEKLKTLKDKIIQQQQLEKLYQQLEEERRQRFGEKAFVETGY